MAVVGVELADQEVGEIGDAIVAAAAVVAATADDVAADVNASAADVFAGLVVDDEKCYLDREAAVAVMAELQAVAGFALAKAEKPSL